MRLLKQKITIIIATLITLMVQCQASDSTCAANKSAPAKAKQEKQKPENKVTLNIHNT